MFALIHHKTSPHYNLSSGCYAASVSAVVVAVIVIVIVVVVGGGDSFDNIYLTMSWTLFVYAFLSPYSLLCFRTFRCALIPFVFVHFTQLLCFASPLSLFSFGRYLFWILNFVGVDIYVLFIKASHSLRLTKVRAFMSKWRLWSIQSIG